MATVDEQLLAQLDAAWQTLAQQQQELDLLVEQTRQEVERADQRFAELRAKLDELDRTLDHYTREELRQLFEAAKRREVQLVALRAELEGLEYKRAVLAEEARTLAWFGRLASDGALRPEPPASASVGGDPTLGDLGAVLLAQEGDRGRIALWLHDRVAQPLHNLALQIELCERVIKSDPARAGEELQALRTLATTVLQDARRAIFELRPMSLDDLGLVPTLERYVQLRAEQDHLFTRLHWEGRARALPKAVETAIFRIVQAALDNVRDHANVGEAGITLAYRDRELAVSVSDKGRGCNLRLLETQLQGKTGLLGMRERARQIGGTITFDSSPGRGMTVRLVIPLVGLLTSNTHRRLPGRP